MQKDLGLVRKPAPDESIFGLHVAHAGAKSTCIRNMPRHETQPHKASCRHGSPVNDCRESKHVISEQDRITLLSRR